MMEIVYYVVYKRRHAQAQQAMDAYQNFSQQLLLEVSNDTTTSTHDIHTGVLLVENSSLNGTLEESKTQKNLDTQCHIDEDLHLSIGEHSSPPATDGFSQSPITVNSREEQTHSIKWKKVALNSLLIVLNLIILGVLFISILSFIEIKSKKPLEPFSLNRITPACSAIHSTCETANFNIDRPSTTIPLGINTTTMQPFSYLIVSDVQLSWYAGESSYIGKLNIPPPCTSLDTCSECTEKFSKYTNRNMKRSLEALMAKDSLSYGPIPKTIIMNGDLTQYFHHFERLSYESYYHNLKGLEEYFPSLGNHDYDQQQGATYSGDEWFGPHYCNAMHSIQYFKSAFCPNNYQDSPIPKFNPFSQVTRYDSKSLSYSWERGRYHFVHLHYYPTYENAKLGISSSVQWLKRDLELAHANNLTNVLFIHAANQLSNVLQDILVANNVVAIFSGHLHRCFGNKCIFIYGMNEYEVNKTLSQSDYIEENKNTGYAKCFPGSTLCSSNANGPGWTLFYTEDMDENMTLPDRKLSNYLPKSNTECPSREYKTFVNETDNTMLCKKYEFPSHYPFEENEESTTTTNSSSISSTKNKIPIFWSGSASFETFLYSAFYDDRIVVTAMTAQQGSEGKRYMDAHSIPNAIYPFHNTSDLEVTIYI
jgi:hypothetical protein